jgi:hypothetical protein
VETALLLTQSSGMLMNGVIWSSTTRAVRGRRVGLRGSFMSSMAGADGLDVIYAIW